jgi:hypothetical protein
LLKATRETEEQEEVNRPTERLRAVVSSLYKLVAERENN